MRIVYMGTPEFAAPALEKLHAQGHEILFAVTQQDKERDRGKKLQFTQVKEKAIALGIPVLQPEKLKGDPEFFRILQTANPDIIVVAAYGKILPAEILALPRFGCVNIHASLLPRHRGAAPIQRAIMEGDKETGVTIMKMDQGLDTGDMLTSGRTQIDGKTGGSLTKELADMGAELLADILPDIERGTAVGVPQEAALATYAPMIFKKDGLLDFNQSPIALERLIRGLDPWPGAYTNYKGEPMKIWEAVPLEEENPAPAGTVTAVSEEGVEISAGGKTLRATVIQMPGKKKMQVREYLKGNKIEKFAVLG